MEYDDELVRELERQYLKVASICTGISIIVSVLFLSYLFYSIGDFF